MDRQGDHLAIQLYRAEEKIEITERIKVPEECPVSFDVFVIVLPEHFRAAERVFDRLTDEKTERETEEFVRDKVEHAHRPLLYRIDQPRAVYEFRFPESDSAVKPLHFFGRHGHVRIVDGEDLSFRHIEASANRISLPFPFLHGE